jgi:hypothetical protein
MNKILIPFSYLTEKCVFREFAGLSVGHLYQYFTLHAGFTEFKNLATGSLIA